MLKPSLSAPAIKHSTPSKCPLPRLLKKPRVVNVIPIEIGGKRTLFLYQATLEYHYAVDLPTRTQEIVENVVFELNNGSVDPRWKVCGKVEPSSEYFA